MASLLLAYPELSAKDLELIQTYRRQYDEYFFNIVAAHFTLVFPISHLSQDLFIKEIKLRSAGFKKFDFITRCATVNKDAFNDLYHVFLVPDEGYSCFVKLHDKLYSVALKDQLRLDIDFIPHIGIASSKDKILCKRIADEWNEKEFSISGSISRVTIVNYESDYVSKIEEIALN